MKTVIRDVIELLGDLTNNGKSVIDKVTGQRGLNGYRNIASGTRDLTLTFPVIVTNATSVETASMIAKAIERKAVTMLQMLFSAVSITNADNALDYIKKFHTNLDVDHVIDPANQTCIIALPLAALKPGWVAEVISQVLNLHHGIAACGINTFLRDFM